MAEVCPVCRGAKTLAGDDGGDPVGCWGCMGDGEITDTPAPEGDECSTCGERVGSPQALIDHAVDRHGLTRGVPDQPPPRRRLPKIAEGKPWEAQSSDNSLNLGSYAFQASLGFVEWAHELIADHGKQPTKGQVYALARRLLRVADRVQAGARADHRVDRMALSHVRCRGAVREAIRWHAVPWGATDDELAEWEDQLAVAAGELLEVAVRLVDAEDVG